jgi:predicted outer membrane protein
LKALVEGSMVKLTLPASLDSEHQRMLDELNAKSGKDFDTSYDQIQVKTRRLCSRPIQEAARIPN